MIRARSTSALRASLEERFGKLLDDTELLFSDLRARTRDEIADSLNQASRRLRQCEGFTDLAATLADAAAGYCGAAAVFRISGDIATGERIRGLDEDRAGRFPGLEIPLAEAAAFQSAVETKDPVVAMGREDEVSSDMRHLCGHGEEARVSLFPLVRGEHVGGLLYCWDNVQTAPLELLAQVAGLCLPVAGPETAAEAEEAEEAALVTITPAIPPAPVAAAASIKASVPEPASIPGGKEGWDALPVEEQHLHLKAQRYARVQVAEMRLFQAEAVHAGRMHRDLYGALQDTIDTARSRFQQTYMAPCPSMVDYLHLELVRTLANDNARSLGEEYPGPLVQGGRC